MKHLIPIALSLLAAWPAAAQTPLAVPSITVEGRASAEAAPDVAVLSLGVATERPRAPDAASENAKIMAAVIAALKSGGVAPADIRTKALRLTDVMDRMVAGAPKAVSYRAENDIDIMVRPVGRAGTLTAELIENGANSIRGVDFRVTDEARIRANLQTAAAEDARSRAETYAAGLGVRIGRVLQVQPSDRFNRVGTFVVQGGVRPVAPAPIESGQETLSEGVSVTFALEQVGGTAP